MGYYGIGSSISGFNNYGGPGGGMPGFKPYSSSDQLFGGGDAGATPGNGSGTMAWVGKNLPTLATIAGIGASIYGAHKAGQAEDKQTAQQAQQWQQQYGLNQRETALHEKDLQARLDADAAEKARRGYAIQRILGMDRTPIAPAAPAGS